jgi:hypothetical protein
MTEQTIKPGDVVRYSVNGVGIVHAVDRGDVQLIAWNHEDGAREGRWVTMNNTKTPRSYGRVSRSSCSLHPQADEFWGLYAAWVLE